MKSRLFRLTRPAARAVAVSALSLSLATSPQAKPGEYVCDNESSTNGSSFSLHMCNMPDIDQRRSSIPSVAGLPNDGKMYCVPTAAMNVAAYISNHGYPQIAPGVANWRLSPPHSEYNTMTANLTTMGQYMDTGAFNGTTGGDAEFGLRLWLNGANFFSPTFVVSHYCANLLYSPTFHDAALSAVAAKSLVIPVVGWYTNPDSDQPHVRDGGHAVTLVHAVGNTANGLGKIGIRDPASPNDGLLASQSPFAVDYYNVQNVFGIFNGWPRTQSRLVGYGGAYMDEYFAVRPKFGLTTDPGNHVVLHLPVDWNEPGAEVTKVFDVPGGLKVVDVAVSPERIRHPYVVENADAVWQIDMATGETTELAPLPGARRLVFGGAEQNLYALGDRALVRLDRDGRERGRASVDSTTEAVAFDDTGKQVVVYRRGGGGSLLFLDEGLRPLREVRLPIPIPGPPDPTKISLCVSGLDGAVWLHADGAASALRVRIDARGNARAEVVDLQGASAPEGLFVDERGHLFVTDDGAIAELDGDGRRVEGSVFGGKAGAGPVRLLRPFSNFDPATMTGPAYVNVLPTEFGESVPD